MLHMSASQAAARSCFYGCSASDSVPGLSPQDLALLNSVGGMPDGQLASLQLGGDVAGNGVHADAGAERHPSHFPEILDVQEFIGSGGFGKVYRCTVEGIESSVAVKVLKGRVSVDGCREAQILMDLSHPNLMQLLRVIGQEHLALVLELCSGGTLQELLHGSPHKQPVALELVPRLGASLDVAAALEYLHSRSVVHRDVKSANALLTEPMAIPAAGGQARMPPVKLGDLGLARFVAASKSIMTRGVGTMAYMAPEVMGGDDYGMPADVFSLAVLMHEVASEQVPYGNAEDPRFAMKVMDGLRPPQEALPPGPASQQLLPLLADSWCPEPTDRISAGCVASRLRSLLASL